MTGFIGMKRVFKSTAVGMSTGMSKVRSQHEHNNQKALIYLCNYYSMKLPELALIHAIPNGGLRKKGVAGKLKAEGAKAGVPDLFLPVGRPEWNDFNKKGLDMKQYHGLYIEMKSETGKVQDSQAWWHKKLREQGYKVAVCYSSEEAFTLILKYLINKTPKEFGVMFQ